MKTMLSNVLLYVGVLMLVELIGLNFLKGCYLPAQAPYTFDIRVYGLLIATPAALICDTIGDITNFSHRELYLTGSIFCILAIYAYLISFGCLTIWKWAPKKRYKKNLVISASVTFGGLVCTWFAQAASLDFIGSILLFPYQCVYGYVSMITNVITDNYIFLVEPIFVPFWGICLYWVVYGGGVFCLVARRGPERVPVSLNQTPRCEWELIVLKIVWRYILGFFIGGFCNVLVILFLLDSSHKLFKALGIILGLPTLFSTTGVTRVIEGCLNCQIECTWIAPPLLFLWGGIYGISSILLLEKIMRKHLPHKWLSLFRANNSPVIDYGIWILCIILYLSGCVLILTGTTDFLRDAIQSSYVFQEDIIKYFRLIIIGCLLIIAGLYMGKKKKAKKTDSETR